MTTPCSSCLWTIAISVAFVAAFFGLLVAAAISDVRSMTVPNGLSVALVVLYPFYVYVTGISWTDGLVAGALIFGIGIICFALNWLGGGDVKLLAAVSLWAGTTYLVPALFITAIAGGVVCAVVWIRNYVRIKELVKPTGDNGFDDGDDVDQSVRSKTLVPYAVAISAGGAFVAFAQLTAIFRLAETVL